MMNYVGAHAVGGGIGAEIAVAFQGDTGGQQPTFSYGHKGGLRGFGLNQVHHIESSCCVIQSEDEIEHGDEYEDEIEDDDEGEHARRR